MSGGFFGGGPMMGGAGGGGATVPAGASGDVVTLDGAGGLASATPAATRSAMGFAPVGSVAGLTFLARWRASSLGLADGAAVAVWADESGNGRDLTASGSARPTYLAASSIGPAVRYDGVANVMATASLVPATGANPRTLYAVIGETTGNDGLRHLMHYGTAATRQAYGLLTNNAGPCPGTHYWFESDTIRTGYNYASASYPRVLVASFDGTKNRVWCNGVKLIEYTPSAALATGSTVPLRMGASVATGEWFGGLVAEAGAVADGLTDAQGVTFSRYLCDAYGVAWGRTS